MTGRLNKDSFEICMRKLDNVSRIQKIQDKNVKALCDCIKILNKNFELHALRLNNIERKLGIEIDNDPKFKQILKEVNQG